jgi:hypothetical protein
MESVFLSYRFADERGIETAKLLLQERGYGVVTGESTDTYVSKGVIDRIRNSDFFFCIMTKHRQLSDGPYITSPWLIEEKGVALALEKPLVIMVEDGVEEFGELQGDWQRTHFTWDRFAEAAERAVGHLDRIAGRQA